MVNPLQTAYIDQSAAVQGHALRKSFERKMLRHGDSCKEVGLIFRPLPIAHMPMDTLVAWSETLVSEVKRIGSSLARQTGGEEGEVYYFSNLLFWLRLTLNIADMTGMNDIFK